MQGNWRDADNRIGVLFILPFAAAALVFMVYPVAEAVRMAFFHVNPLDPAGERFAGLDNFRTVFADPLFWKSFRNAAVWTACVFEVTDEHGEPVWTVPVSRVAAIASESPLR